MTAAAEASPLEPTRQRLSCLDARRPRPAADVPIHGAVLRSGPPRYVPGGTVRCLDVVLPGDSSDLWEIRRIALAGGHKRRAPRMGYGGAVVSHLWAEAHGSFTRSVLLDFLTIPAEFFAPGGPALAGDGALYGGSKVGAMVRLGRRALTLALEVTIRRQEAP